MTTKETNLLMVQLKGLNDAQLAMTEKQNETAVDVRLMKDRLYGDGKNGFEGDIPEIKKLLEKYDNRISRNSRFIYWMLGLLAASGIGIGASTFIG